MCPHCENKHKNTWLWPPYINTSGSRGCLQCSVDEISPLPGTNLSLYRYSVGTVPDLKRCIWKFCQIFSPSLFETFQANVKISFFFSASDFSNRPCTPQSTLYSRMPGFLSSRPNRITPPPHPQVIVAHCNGHCCSFPKGVDSLACGGKPGRTQFRPRD